MKHIPIFLAIFVLLLSSCITDEGIQPGGNAAEATVRFSLHTTPMMDGSPSTRSTDTLAVNDSSVVNIWIFQFVGGVFQKKLYLAPSDWHNFEVNLIAKGTSNLYFLANAGPNAFAPEYAPASASALIATVASEAACLYTAGSGTKYIPMRGSVTGITPDKDVMQTLHVPMVRLMARIDFSYSVAPILISSKGFNVKRIRLRNVNTQLSLNEVTAPIYPANGTLVGTDFTYEAGIDNTSRTLTFYVPDNRRGTGTNTALIDARLKTGISGQKPTYIEVVGTTSTGDEYAFSLYPGADAFNDYNIRANTHYRLSANFLGLSLSDLRLKKAVSSNCYIVAPGSSVDIPVSRANLSALGTQLPDVSKDWTASIYWQTASGLVTVSETKKTEGLFTVTANASTMGNAVVVVKNATGDVVWSWHVWVTNYDPATDNENLTDFTWMKRNLGAIGAADGTSVTFATSGGLYYQWGRDPFPGSDGLTTGVASPLPIYGATGTDRLTNASTSLGWSTTRVPAITNVIGDVVMRDSTGTVGNPIPYTNQLLYSVRYPLLHLKFWSGSTATVAAAATAEGGLSSWGGQPNEVKSLYDPCPQGWRVPSSYKTGVLASPWSTWTEPQPMDTTAFTALRWSGVNSFYPVIGSRQNTTGAFYNVGIRAYYWSASVLSTTGAAYALNIYADNVKNNASYTRYNGHPVRCVKE